MIFRVFSTSFVGHYFIMVCDSMLSVNQDGLILLFGQSANFLKSPLFWGEPKVIMVPPLPTPLSEI
jgi:hypothetical protein